MITNREILLKNWEISFGQNRYKMLNQNNSSIYQMRTNNN